MSGNIFQDATELSVGERDGSVLVTFRRTGDLSQPVTLTYGVTPDTATPGSDYTPPTAIARMEAGEDFVSIRIDVQNDTLFESTESFVVSIINVDSGTLGVPRTARISILDDENPVLPPVEPPLVSPYLVTQETVVSGLDAPITLEFSSISSEIAYVGTKGGTVRALNIVTGADLGVILDISARTNNVLDRGLYDIAFHPDLATNPYMYVSYVVDPSGTGGAGRPDFDVGGNRFMHVVRYTVTLQGGVLRPDPASGVVIAGAGGQSYADINGAGFEDFSDTDFAGELSSEAFINAASTTPTTIIGGLKQNYIKVDSLTHAGGALAFGPDGALYISTGDGSSPNYADPHAASVQNINSMSGKILRVDPLTGRGLADNPFVTSGMSLDANAAKVWQMGLRNPFSMGFDPLGRLFISETGWNQFEEINVGEAGANFGWPWYEGGVGGTLNQTGGYELLSPAASFYQAVANGTIKVVAPYAAFGHAADEPGFQNQAITAGSVVYLGDRYPADINGDFFFSDFVRGNMFVIDSNNRQDIRFLAQSTGTLGPVTYVQGPDGYVYFVDIGNPFEEGAASGSIGRLKIFSPGGPSVTVSAPSAPVTEGAGASVTVTFSLSEVQTSDVTVSYLTTGTAASGSDFTSASNGSVVIPAGSLTVNVVFLLVNDTTYEPIETFNVALKSATSATMDIYAAGSATVTVFDDEVPPLGTNLLINGSFESPAQGAGTYAAHASVPGWTAIAGGVIETWNAFNGDQAPNGTWRVLSGATDGANYLELDYAGAQDGFYQDVQTQAGQAYQLSFDARLREGSAASTQAIEIVWNGVVVATRTPGSTTWAQQTLSVTGTGGADRLTIREPVAQGADGFGAMLDNFKLVATAPPAATQLAISGAPSLAEGNAGTTAFTFTVTRSGVTTGAGTVAYAVTGSGTNAAAAADFTGGTLPSGTVSFAAGETSKTIQVAVAGDTTFEQSETFTVTLSSPSPSAGSAITTAVATGTIINDDAPPVGTNLLINGSFEQPVQGAGTYAAHASVPGWTAIAGGVIETWNAFNGDQAPNGTWRVLSGATDGANYLELDYAGAQDGFYQDVQTQAGQAYQLSFDARLREGSAASTQAIEIVWNGVVVATRTPGSTTWAQQTLSVTGTGGADRLTIREPVAQGADGFGAMLDNFKLVATAPPAATQLAISGAPSLAEGNAGSKAFTFTVVRSGVTTGVTSVNYAATGTGPAIADAADFGGLTPSGTLSFAAGETLKTITVQVSGDTTVEQDETFTLTLSGATGGAAITTATATGTILNDDIPPPVANLGIAGSSSIVEGNSGATSYTFTVNRSNDLSGVTTVDYKVTGGLGFPADAGDFGGLLPSGSLIFAAGETLKTITVQVSGDTTIEQNESFDVTLSNASIGANIITATATGIILDDDTPPVANLAISGSPNLAEGNSGSTPFTFTVTRSVETSGPTSVNYSVAALANGSAAPSDFAGGIFPTGAISFAAGETVKTITVNVQGDTTVEDNEGFRVTLSNASGGAIVTVADAIGTIRNDDVPLGVNLLINGSFESPAQGAGTYAAHSSVPGWTAIAGGVIETWNAFGGDQAPNGTWRVLSGATDGANYLELDYAGAQDGFYQDVQTQAGQAYQLSFDARLREGSAASTQAIEIVWNGVVVATRTPGSTTWAQQTLSVTGTGGADRLTIREPVAQGADGFGAMLDNCKLVATAPPAATQLAISGAPSLAEGNAGTTAFTFTVTRSGVTTGAGTVAYAVTGSGTNAAAAADFTGGTLPSGTVSFAAGETSKTIQVAVAGDTTFEQSETFTVTLSSPSPSAGSAITTAVATGTIINDDAPPVGTNLLINGSFEQPVQGAGTYAAHASVPGWTAIAGGVIETWNAFGGDQAPNGTWRVLSGATDGANYLELDYAGAQDGFYQDVQTQAGQAYQLSFDARLREGSAASTQAIEIVWNGVVVATRTPGSTTWAQQTLSVTGTGGADRLTIREPVAQGADGFGAMLDNFKLVVQAPAAAPEILTFASLLPPEMIEQAMLVPTGMFDIAMPLLIDDVVIPATTWEADHFVGLVGLQLSDAHL